MYGVQSSKSFLVGHRHIEIKIVRCDILKDAKCHYAYYTVMPLSHRFFVHVLFPLNLQGNPFTIMSLPLLKLIIVCARRYSHRRISLSKDVGRDL